MTDVVLVAVPFAAIERPSIALGLLQALLRRDGTDTTTVHPSLSFAEAVGAGACAFAEVALGEAVFSDAAFPHAATPLRERALDAWALQRFERHADLDTLGLARGRPTKLRARWRRRSTNCAGGS